MGGGSTVILLGWKVWLNPESVGDMIMALNYFTSSLVLIIISRLDHRSIQVIDNE